jgi:protein phosphatase
MSPLAHGYRTNTGNVRDHNEDCYLADSELGLWLVADGMGGHESGEVASAITRDDVGELVGQGTPLAEAIQQAHQNIIEAANNGTGSPGMGSTIVAVQVEGFDYEICWVGDSRAYLWDGRLRQISKDHSFVQRMLDNGSINQEEAIDHPDKNLIYQCLGVRELKTVSVGQVAGQFLAGQKLLLCSDGLNDEVRDSVIAQILQQDTTDQVLVDELIAAALANAGSDNVTVLLISAPEGAPQELFEQDVFSQTQSIDINRPKTQLWKYAAVAIVFIMAVILYYLMQVR